MAEHLRDLQSGAVRQRRATVEKGKTS
jgi:hypothetical protein